eukprot:PITA_34288
MHQFHSSICGGHHYWKTTAHKILRAGYYWPNLFTDVCSFVRSCDKCQKFAGRQQLKSLPLKPVHTNDPFQQWGLDFIGEINPHSNGQHKWILVATDYFTKWIEIIPTKNANHQVVIKFLNENIFNRFGCPTKLVTDNAVAFKAKELVDMTEFMGIQLVHSTSYYPQGNGLAESSNKNLIREQLVEKSRIRQKRIKETFDRKAKMDRFQVGDWVLKCDALKERKGNHGKFDSLWTSLFFIAQIQQNNTFILHSLEGEDVFGGPVNGRFLKLYFI